jgi:hypothetical protein
MNHPDLEEVLEIYICILFNAGCYDWIVSGQSGVSST